MYPAHCLSICSEHCGPYLLGLQVKRAASVRRAQDRGDKGRDTAMDFRKRPSPCVRN